jgi:hypothetical protein
MIKHITSLLILLFVFECNNIIAQKPQDKSTSLSISKINYKIIPSINNTWGYDIFIDNKLKIHQTTIPGLPGSEGFKTKKTAEKVAKLVLDKINKGILPPTITIEELKKIKAI